MTAILRCFAIGICLGGVASAGEPTMTAEDLPNLVLPDVHVLSSVHHDGSTPANGTNVAHVDVDGVVGGSIHFELLLPDDWNGRFVMGGGGGLVGSVQNHAKRYVSSGYATVGTDTGHQAGGADGSWALDDMEALVNFGHVAVHRTSEVAKAIIYAYYGKRPDKSYFYGCSRGGGQALMEAQRYPDDFDGIVAGAPAFDWNGIAALGVQIAQTMYPDPSNLTKTFISRADLRTLYAAVIEQADGQDGLEDGIIDDPATIQFDLTKVEGLSKKQRDAIAEIYDGFSNSEGLSYPGYEPGSEEGWFQWLIGPMPGGMPDLSFALSTNIAQYFVFNKAKWDYTTCDFSTWKEDSHLAATILNADNPNLDAFKSRGGKLILWHGWADPALPPERTVEYYEDVLAHDPDAMEYARFFLVPGCSHCGGGPGISEVDWVDVLARWVEKGEAPDRVVASKAANGDTPAKTRPLFPYPQRAHYRGEGDPNDAASFVAIQD